jgi:hypothetical protein
MNYQEANSLMNRLSMFFPQFAGKHPESKKGYIEKIIGLEYDRASAAIEGIINTTTSARGPSVAELLTTILQTKLTSSLTENCTTCDSTGWIFDTQIVNGKKYDVVKDCHCSPRQPEVKAAGPSGYPQGKVGWIESLRSHDTEPRKRISIAEQEEEPF